jgi:hypothetical protein
MSRAQERSTAIRAERVPTFSNPWGLLAITSTPGTGPKASWAQFSLVLSSDGTARLAIERPASALASVISPLAFACVVCCYSECGVVLLAPPATRCTAHCALYTACTACSLQYSHLACCSVQRLRVAALACCSAWARSAVPCMRSGPRTGPRCHSSRGHRANTGRRAQACPRPPCTCTAGNARDTQRPEPT